MVKVLLVFLIFISSCAVKEKSCEVVYKETLKFQQKLPENYEAKGVFYINNLPAIFKAKFSEEESINFYTIFGQKLGQVQKEKGIICINVLDLNKCGGEDLYSELLKIDIPQQLKNILVGKVKISKDAKYYCTKNGLVVEDNGVKYIFEGKRLVKIEYRIYKVVYNYYTDKTVINIYSKDKSIAKIEIKSIKAL